MNDIVYFIVIYR